MNSLSANSFLVAILAFSRYRCQQPCANFSAEQKIFVCFYLAVNTGPLTISVNLWSAPGEASCLASSVFRRGSKRRHPMEHEKVASFLRRSTIVNWGICMQPPMKTESAYERSAVYSRESSEKSPSYRHRRQSVSFCAEVFRIYPKYEY